MKRSMLISTTMPFFFLAIAGCVGSVGGESSTEASASASPSAAPQRAEAQGARGASTLASKLEEASRQVDVGRGASVEKELATIANDPAATPDEHDHASLALARAEAATGNVADSASTLEALLAEHGNDHNWPLASTVEGTLRKLLTGSDVAPRSQPARSDEQPTSAFARALAAYFPARGGRVEVNQFFFGGSSDVSERLGTFNVARAVRDMKREACSLCDEGGYGTHSGRYGDWIGIARAGEARKHALSVYYFSLDGRKIPSRYDAELPMPSSEIAARLERGHGLIAAKERDGAPPAILIAAPRVGEIPDVEEALAAMKSLPREPVDVPLQSGLRPAEIRPVVDASRKDQRACYEELLSRQPDAEGTVTLKLGIEGDGTVSDASIDAPQALRDADFVACMQGVATKLSFPTTGTRGSITMPLRLARTSK